MGLFGAFFNVSSEETINSGVRATGTRTHITGNPTTLARALIMAARLHCAGLTLGSFLYNRLASTNTNGQPEIFGGIINADNELALAVVPAAEKWNRGSNSLVSVVVDSGTSGHYFDDALIPGLRYRLDNYQKLAIRRWITTAGGHQLEGAGQVLLRVHIIDAQGVQRLIQILVLIVPGLRRNLVSVKQASRNGAVSIFDKHNPRLEANNFALPLQELENDLYFVSLDLVSGSSGPELAMQAAAIATLWHRRMGHLNRKRLDLLKKVNNNGVSFDRTVPDCDVCAVGKSRQRAHLKTADQHIQRPFQLVFTDLMRQFTPEALGGYKYVSKISDEHTRWTEIYLLKSKDGALHEFQSFVQSMVIPSRVRVERLRADKGGEFIGNDFKDYCTQTVVLLEYVSTNTPQQIGMSERVGETLAAMGRCMLADSELPMFLWGELMLTAAYVGSTAPHSAVNMQSPYKMLKGTEPDLRILCVIGARAFVHIERCTQKLALKAVEGRLVGYSSNSKSYRVYDPVPQCIMESRNAIFIETPSRLLPPPTERPHL